MIPSRRLRKNLCNYMNPVNNSFYHLLKKQENKIMFYIQTKKGRNSCKKTYGNVCVSYY